MNIKSLLLTALLAIGCWAPQAQASPSVTLIVSTTSTITKGYDSTGVSGAPDTVDTASSEDLGVTADGNLPSPAGFIESSIPGFLPRSSFNQGFLQDPNSVFGRKVLFTIEGADQFAYSNEFATLLEADMIADEAPAAVKGAAVPEPESLALLVLGLLALTISSKKRRTTHACATICA